MKEKLKVMINITQEQVMQNWNSDSPLVSISCITYNHAPYISQTLDGFLMQKTNFAFEILIHDDASVDRTADIIRGYEAKFPKLIKPIYQKENQYSQGKTDISERWNFPRAKGKYIALCEGDDYWIDENKLQMQVDFLEGNSEYGLCYSQVKQFVQKTGKCLPQNFGAFVKDFDDLLYNGNRIPTPTTIFRKDLLDRYLEEIDPGSKNWLMGDYPIWLFLTHESKIKFINQPTSVYRILEKSACHCNDVEKQVIFSKSFTDIAIFFANKYEKQPPIFDEGCVRFYICYSYFLSSKDKNYLKDLRKNFNFSKKKTFSMRVIFILSFIPWLLNVVVFLKRNLTFN